MSRIITANKCPLIPDRRWDWCAYHDGEEESGHYGWGETEAEAIEDLKRLDAERDEANEGRAMRRWFLWSYGQGREE